MTEQRLTAAGWAEYQRVYQDYARYAGIPNEVRYTLDYHLPDKDDTEAWTRYYQSYEWDRTEGWDSKERVSLLDRQALSIASDNRTSQSEDDDDTSYVVLMRCVPDSAIRLANRANDEPVACFEQRGDVLHAIRGKERRLAMFVPSKITRRFQGELALCGYKSDGRPMVIRGRQDVGRIYATIHAKHLQGIQPR